MQDDELIEMLRAYHESLFPKDCHNCGRRFLTLRDYLEHTKALWPTISYDAELSDFKPAHPLGAVSMANCACGSTVALATDHMPLEDYHALLEWLRTEALARGKSRSSLLDHLRGEIRRRVLSNPGTS